MGQLLGLILLCSGMMSLCYAALLIKCADYVKIMLRLSTQHKPYLVWWSLKFVSGPFLSRKLCSQQFSCLDWTIPHHVLYEPDEYVHMSCIHSYWGHLVRPIATWSSQTPPEVPPHNDIHEMLYFRCTNVCIAVWGTCLLQ